MQLESHIIQRVIKEALWVKPSIDNDDLLILIDLQTDKIYLYNRQKRQILALFNWVNVYHFQTSDNYLNHNLNKVTTHKNAIRTT